MSHVSKISRRRFLAGSAALAAALGLALGAGSAEARHAATVHPQPHGRHHAHAPPRHRHHVPGRHRFTRRHFGEPHRHRLHPGLGHHHVPFRRRSRLRRGFGVRRRGC